ncbi:MAG: hypothetical protein ACNA7J_09185, partial [Wenzhouxiangella sp.]
MTLIRKAALFIFLVLPVQVLGQGLSLEQIAELRQVSGAEISPDGTHIAWVQSIPRDLDAEEDGPSWSEL